ncbi:hypothetical protein [Streptomyces zingiberis]|uniref:Uncharacterized protein n=1 Tax=Streptomyces zingiberis TaxID=2053010 RepID=A0ABX1BRI2_9ACTN|nr:hypothetical protein [Streptomyces zingiberis]NJQ00336.1 hypothetical protein [Streptomyces zingiberis]
MSVSSNRNPASGCAVGQLALDARKGRIGVVMDTQGGRMYLRRPEGGREWEAAPQDVRPATPGEAAEVSSFAGAPHRRGGHER